MGVAFEGDRIAPGEGLPQLVHHPRGVAQVGPRGAAEVFGFVGLGDFQGRKEFVAQGRRRRLLRDADVEFLQELGPAHRLGQVGVEAGGLAAGAVGLERHRGQGQQAGGAAAEGALLGPDGRGGGDPVHDRHLDIQQHRVEILGAPKLERGGAIHGRADVVAGAPQAGDRDLAVHLVVLGEEDPQGASGRTRRRPGVGGFGRPQRFPGEAGPEPGQGDGLEQLGLAAQFELGRREQEGPFGWDRRQAGIDVLG